ncbi:MAG: hypothetical protein AAFY71_20525 [Bacteroidota bacterium]
MKSIFLITSSFLFLLGSLNFTSAQTSQEAADYMQEISTPFVEIKDETWKYLKAVTRGKGARKVENKRQALISELKAEKSALKKKDSFYGDESLKKSTNEYLDLYYTVLKEDYDKILDMEEIAEQSYDLMEAYLLAQEKASDKLNEAFELYQTAQESFASSHNVRLMEAEQDKRSKKIDKASETLSYYNDVFLVFFKVFKQEVYVLDAIGKNDLSGIEQNASALASMAEEGMKTLKDMKDFDGDAKLKAAATQMMIFYKKEAENEFADIADFYLKKDNFEKAQQVIESKSKKERTQEDVDRFNKAVNEYNEAVNSFNELNESSYKKRVKQQKLWDKQVQAFFEEHSA